MLRKLIAACALTIVSSVCWAGQYDGIWNWEPGNYQIIRHQDNGTFVLVFVGSDTGRLYGSWAGTFIGSISGNTTSNLLASDTLEMTNTTLTLTFSSTTAATITFNQCTPKPNQPADICPPLNTPIPLNKIF